MLLPEKCVPFPNFGRSGVYLFYLWGSIFLPMKYHYILLVALLFCKINVAAAQEGCTDPQALNFNALAVMNNGSCMYPTTTYIPVLKSTLPGSLNEISGLVYANGTWWAHNDSGNSNQFQEINPATGSVIRTVTLDNVTNRDWEDVAAVNDTLFIGDFGNNGNNRTDLGVYTVPIEAIQGTSNPSVPASSYTFTNYSYPDQSDFSAQPQDSTVFDCEAMLFASNRLHLFSKNHRDYTTSHYTVNPLTGETTKKGTLDIGGMITGADISPDGKVIALVGYNLRGLPAVFCWFLWDWPAGTDDYFQGNKRRIEFGSALISGQVESIAFSGNRSGYIANENTTYNGIPLVAQGIRTFDCSQWIPEVSETSEPLFARERLRVHPNPATEETAIFWEEGFTPLTLRLFTANGKLIQKTDEPESGMSIRSESGIHFLVVQWNDGFFTTKCIVFE